MGVAWTLSHDGGIGPDWVLGFVRRPGGSRWEGCGPPSPACADSLRSSWTWGPKACSLNLSQVSACHGNNQCTRGFNNAPDLT